MAALALLPLQPGRPPPPSAHFGERAPGPPFLWPLPASLRRGLQAAESSAAPRSGPCASPKSSQRGLECRLLAVGARQRRLPGRGRGRLARLPAPAGLPKDERVANARFSRKSRQQRPSRTVPTLAGGTCSINETRTEGRNSGPARALAGPAAARGSEGSAGRKEATQGGHGVAAPG